MYDAVLRSRLVAEQQGATLFSDESADIRGILTDALDLLGIAWRQNRRNSISIARAEAVEALDEFVGPKS